MDSLKTAIAELISEATGRNFQIAESQALGGGCIHDATCLTGADGRKFFVKQNDVALLDSFQAEMAALEVIAETKTIRVPLPIGARSVENKAVLVLEFLPLGQAGKRDWGALGQQLARLHQCTGKAYGWSADNWIGSSPQRNREDRDWITFYRECRLAPQFEWASQRGLQISGAEELMTALPSFFTDYTPAASLLHGDLWAGNADFLENGTPVIYDPAAYYGDREADIALTELFGGYPEAFYNGYAGVWKLNEGYRRRKTLYNLYHVLNHFNIFGGGYGSQASSMVGTLLRLV